MVLVAWGAQHPAGTLLVHITGAECNHVLGQTCGLLESTLKATFSPSAAAGRSLGRDAAIAATGGLRRSLATAAVL